MGFQQGLSGLNASSKALDTIGNNIATSGTITLSLSASWRSHDWVDFSFLQWSTA